MSEEKTFENGTPQGGILSPLLFNLLVERLLTTTQTRQAHVLCYADDIAIVEAGHTHLARTRELLRSLLASCDSLGLLSYQNKSKAMAFGYAEPSAPFYIGDVPIPWVNTTYLGMQLDTSLSFRPYITTIRDRMNKRINAMRALAGRPCGGRRQGFPLILHERSQCLLRLRCSLPSSGATISPPPLETTQNKALRILLDAPL